MERLGQAAGKLVALHHTGWRLLLMAQLALLRATLVVRGTPRGKLVRALTRPTGKVEPPRPEDRVEVEAVGLAIDRAARWGIGRPLCLVRSLAYHDLLCRRGIPGSTIRVGVRLKRGQFQAHAWVEWAGEVVGEDATQVASFQPFPALQPDLEDVSWTARRLS